MIRKCSLLFAGCALLSSATACQVVLYKKCKSILGMLKTCDPNNPVVLGEDTPDGMPDTIWGWAIQGACGVTLYPEADYQGEPRNLAGMICLCNGSPIQGYKSIKVESYIPDDAFSVVFFSDVEENYRSHKSSHAERVIDAMREIKDRNLKYDGLFASVKVEPELWIHGGDMANYWDVTFWDDLFGDDDGAANAWNGVWKKFYSSGKPMISTFGNHDWHKADHVLSSGDRSTNKKTRDSVEKVMDHAARVSDELTYTRIEPAGDIGQSYYVVDFKGIQIAIMGWQPLLPSSDNSGNPVSETSQWESFKAAMDTSKTALFVSHVPLRKMDEKSTVRDFIDNWESQTKPSRAGHEYPAAAHLSGHQHYWDNRGYNGQSSNRVRDYTVTYPYDNYGDSEEKRGFYSILVSPTHGVLQVKQHTFTTDCWGKGTLCGAGTTCEQNCCYDGGVKYDWWWSKMFTACGEWKCMKGGTPCGPGGFCNGCCNGSIFWVCL